MNDEGDRSPAGPVPVSTAFDLLSDSRRRSLLQHLLARDRSVAVADVARWVAAEERDAPVDAVPFEEVEHVYVSLYHVHLPRLEAEGIVEHDRDRNVVALTERVRHLTPWTGTASDEPVGIPRGAAAPRRESKGASPGDR